MMEREEFGDLERKLSNGEESRLEEHESDNAWQFKSVPEEESEKWKIEKERYDEVIEYIREVDEILNLIKPFPREGNSENRVEPPVRSHFQAQSPRFGLDHLENIIKLVEQLKELQENNYRSGERTFYLKDLKKLREHKKKLKSEEVEMRARVRVRSITTPDEFEMCLVNRKSSSTSEKLEHEHKENWQDKRKSICLGENRSKVSKWTKVKEAFHWEKTSAGPKTLKRENSAGEKNLQQEEWEVSPDGSAPDVFSFPPTPPPPLSQPPLPISARPEDLLSARPAQDFPSSSSSDRLDEVLVLSELKENKKSEPDSLSHPFSPDDIEEVELPSAKSSCEEFAQHLSKEDRSTKSNKTTWGKVKDIIQTRKDSLKKKPKKRGSDECKKKRKLSTVSNAQSSDQFEDLSSPEDKLKSLEIIPKPVYDLSDEASSPAVEEKCAKILTPALTVTLPSTEELRNFSFDDIDKREGTEEDRPNILGQFSCQAQYSEDKSKFGKNKTGSNQRVSRWVKVKRVFLTSGSPMRSPQFLAVGSSSPTSQNKSCGFFSDLESDDLSSGEWIDDKPPSLEKQKPNYSEPQSAAAMTIIQEDIRKSYNELQKKLSQEFDQKLKEWEVKTEAPGSSSLRDESFSKPRGDDGDCIPKFRKTRDSITVPLPNLNDLSPEFKKKLSDWKKMKTSQISSSVSNSATKDEVQGQNIKIRIGEWQPWRSRCSGKGAAKVEQGLSEDHPKKFEEGQKGWKSSRPPANRRKDEEGEVAGSADRRGSKRRDSVKKISHSRTSSGGDSVLSAGSADSSGKFIRRSQKVKDFHWVEKELQKIEREKLRLEQEKEKYLEREARLEKMKRTMGASPTQEILVRTPEGFFRFKGISQKFTKKLYEWEKARGIAPEASTFALLEESARTGMNGDADPDGAAMQRSKSTGSVPELSSTLIIQTMAHHPSSLSLNDVDELKLEEEESISLETKEANEEPEATIVDVEDFEEETAVLAEDPPFHSETPIYTYTSEEIDRITESRGRFYLSGEFGVESAKESDSTTAVEVFDVSRGRQNNCRNKKLRSEDSERRESKDNYLEHQVEEKVVEGATQERFQDEEEKTSEIPLPSSRTLTFERFRPRAKDIYEVKKEKTENLEATDVEISEPALPQCDKDYPQRMEKVQTTSPFCSSRTETQELSFERKSARSKPDPQVLKRKIKEKITLMQRMSTEGSWKYADFDFGKTNDKIRSSEEVEDKAERLEKKTMLEGVLEGVIESGGNAKSEKNGSISVFVQTTRKIISPVKTSDGATPSVCSYVIDDVKPETQEQLEKNTISLTSVKSSPKKQDDSCLSDSNSTSPILQKKNDVEFNPKRDIGMPPLPNSPKTYKKLNPKETAPSIRMIIAKYNQKISEHDNPEGKRTESGSPIWRSPVFGRRTQEKIEKFCVKDDESGRKKAEVQKSASLDNMQARVANRSSLIQPQDQESPIKGILKSSSAGVMRTRPQNQDSAPEIAPVPDVPKETSPSALRAMKIQKAKEDFLSGRPGGSSDASSLSTESRAESLPQAETQAKLTQSEVKPEQSLTKSVSAETIAAGETGRSDSQSGGRSLQKSSSKFDISSIKSKFRKIRMRKEKDSKFNAVAVLCRQSLFIEVPKASESSSMSKSCPSSPVMDRNKHENQAQVSLQKNKKPPNI